MEPALLYDHFINLGVLEALQVVVLGLIGGTLSGFIGSGGGVFTSHPVMEPGGPWGVVPVSAPGATIGVTRPARGDPPAGAQGQPRQALRLTPGQPAGRISRPAAGP